MVVVKFWLEKFKMLEKRILKKMLYLIRFFSIQNLDTWTTRRAGVANRSETKRHIIYTTLLHLNMTEDGANLLEERIPTPPLRRRGAVA